MKKIKKNSQRIFNNSNEGQVSIIGWYIETNESIQIEMLIRLRECDQTENDTKLVLQLALALNIKVD